MSESSSNSFELEIDPSWGRSDVAERLRAIADLIEQGYNCGQSWELDLEWDLDVVEVEDEDCGELEVE